MVTGKWKPPDVCRKFPTGFWGPLWLTVRAKPDTPKFIVSAPRSDAHLTTKQIKYNHRITDYSYIIKEKSNKALILSKQLRGKEVEKTLNSNR